MEIADRVFIVTGGASGLGEAVVRHLAARKARVLILDLDEARGRALVQELGAQTGFARTDVGSEVDVQAAVDRAMRDFGGLHGAVNCAGIATSVKVLGKEGPGKLADFARVININLIGTYNVIRLAAHGMSSQAPNADGERGVLINTASVAAYDGQIGQPAYAASKAGVVGLTLPVARELARFGIRCVTIAPGLFATPMMESLPPEVKEVLGKQVPFPARLGRPHEYALLVQQIIENPMLNGETIRLDGALRMPPK
ncbi:MAG TPA: 3-hydroxyacyl-CoA dehydrogenase [Steroidobacteraceae bacterium]|nr:3-hydroxyacyl-CoA dehydrogenase [Steroidobacteraceae bacterium]